MNDERQAFEAERARWFADFRTQNACIADQHDQINRLQAELQAARAASPVQQPWFLLDGDIPGDHPGHDAAIDLWLQAADAYHDANPLNLSGLAEWQEQMRAAVKALLVDDPFKGAQPPTPQPPQGAQQEPKARGIEHGYCNVAPKCAEWCGLGRCVSHMPREGETR
jgi:hypothetical protein